MNPSYFRIELPLKEAMKRFSKWHASKELAKPKRVQDSKAVSLAVNKKGEWRGSALFVYDSDGWTVFQDLSGHISSIASPKWLTFAQKDAFLLAGYNDAIGYGRLLAIEGGKIVKDFLEDEDADELINEGKEKRWKAIKSWTDVNDYIDEDSRAHADKGFLWMHAVK